MFSSKLQYFCIFARKYSTCKTRFRNILSAVSCNDKSVSYVWAFL